MRHLISIIGLMIIVGAGYFAVAQYADVAHGQSGLLAVTQTSGGASADGAQVLALLNTLNNLKLDGKILSNPNFVTLQDWSITISKQSVGRQNPFLPVYGATPVTASTTKVALPKANK
jgi:hypothetical protein